MEKGCSQDLRILFMIEGKISKCEIDRWIRSVGSVTFNALFSVWHSMSSVCGKSSLITSYILVFVNTDSKNMVPLQGYWT